MGLSPSTSLFDQNGGAPIVDLLNGSIGLGECAHHVAGDHSSVAVHLHLEIAKLIVGFEALIHPRLESSHELLSGIGFDQFTSASRKACVLGCVVQRPSFDIAGNLGGEMAYGRCLDILYFIGHSRGGQG